MSIPISVTEIGIDTDSHKDICSHIYGKTDTETDTDARTDASVSLLSDLRFSFAKETYTFEGGVATISRLLQNNWSLLQNIVFCVGLFCKRDLCI